MISDLLTTYNTYMSTTFSNNEMLIGIVSGMLLGMLSYILQAYPIKLFRFTLKHTSRTLEVSSDSYVYTDVMDVLKNEGIFLKARNLRLKNGIWGWSKKHEETLGLGAGWYFLRNNLVQIHIYQEEFNSDRVIHTMRMRVLGNGLTVINNIIAESNKKIDDESKTNVYRVINNNVELFSTQPRYTLDNVVLSKEAEEAIKRVIAFGDNEEFYKKNGMAWKYGTLLHGVPGTGKTKLLKCIAGEMGWDILEITSISQISNLPKLDAKTVVSIEEIDKMVGANKTIDDDVNEPSSKPEEPTKDDSSQMITNMMKGDFLTSIDGICELHGILIIATTNHIEYLDKAMYRDGRMDEVIEFTTMGMYEFEQFFKRYYPNETIPNDYELGSVTGSELEKSQKQMLTKVEFLDKFRYKG